MFAACAVRALLSYKWCRKGFGHGFVTQKSQVLKLKEETVTFSLNCFAFNG